MKQKVARKVIVRRVAGARLSFNQFSFVAQVENYSRNA